MTRRLAATRKGALSRALPFGSRLNNRIPKHRRFKERANQDTAPASELERRKQLKLRLRRDLSIEPHKYEGRTYFVIKDPISLRYYHLKENEHFLLQFLDGGHTLEDAQKASRPSIGPID